MNNNHPGKRIIQFREHFGLKQGELSEAIGMVQSNVSKIESGKLGLSNTILYYMMAYYAVNPDWVKTGQGEMFISSEEYLSKGIALLGAKKISEGLVEILKDPQFQEFHSYIAIDNSIKENLSDELKEFLQLVSKLWHQGDERTRRTLVQLITALPNVEEQGKKDGGK